MSNANVYSSRVEAGMRLKIVSDAKGFPNQEPDPRQVVTEAPSGDDPPQEAFDPEGSQQSQ